MSHLPSLIIDLALILSAAGVMTLLFKWLKQPLVLGYVLAGVLAGPHLGLLPVEVHDTANIQTWADIGVIILLFALGLEFSFKKLLAVGKTAFVTTMVIVAGMMSAGLLVGHLLGWSTLNGLFLGGMLCMSSTTIIIKAFNDTGMKEAPHAKLVFGVLVVEDLVAVLLMVLLSTISVSKVVDGSELLFSLSRLLFFLCLWFLFGIYLIPTFLKRVRNLLSDETLLILITALCLVMVVLAVKAGFSAALGAFIMGSILSETHDLKRIEKVLEPLKLFFGAIFFVSVGMLVQPDIIADHVWTVLILIVSVLVGQVVFASLGLLLSGQPLQTALRSAFSLGQIGEFAFIIAGLGISLKVTESFLYPIVIAVSVFTIFTTPYMMRLADPLYGWLIKVLPPAVLERLNRRGEVKTPSDSRTAWQTVLQGFLVYMMVLVVVVIAFLFLSLHYLHPFLVTSFSPATGALLSYVITLVALSPFLRAMLSNNVQSAAFLNLWMEKAANQRILLVLVGLRLAAVFATLLFVTNRFFDVPLYINLLLALIVLVLIMRSKWLLRRFWHIEARFLINLNERHMEENYRKIEANQGVRQLSDMQKNHWLDYKLYTCAFRLRQDSPYIGQAIKDLRLRTDFNLMVIRIRTKDDVLMNVPTGDHVLKPGDSIRLAGKKSQLRTFQEDERLSLQFVDHSFMTLHGFSILEYNRKRKGDRILCAGMPLNDASPLVGKTLRESDMGARTKCLVIGLERQGKQLVNPDANTLLLSDDLVWLIGEEKAVSRHIEQNVYFT